VKVKKLLAVSYGHFAIDVLNASIAMVLTSAAGLYDLSVSQIGLGAMICTLSASLTQPLFGILADRFRGRWLGAAGLLWMATFYALAPFAPGYWAMVAFLAIGALGSGALHPVGIVHASSAGGRLPTMATSIFFVSGQTGLALGPFLAGLAIQTVGLQVGMPIMALATIPAVFVMAILLHAPIEDSGTPTQTRAAPSSSASKRSRGLFVATAFVLLIAFRSSAMQSYMVLLPKHFSDAGYEPAVYGAIIGVLTLGGAMGTFAGGYLGDKFNRRIVIFLATLLSVPFLLGLLNGAGVLLLASAALAGALLNIPHSILLVMAQQLLPARKGMVGGAVLGFMFAIGSVSAWLASLLADVVGLETVLTVLAFFPIAAGICALVLPSTRQPSVVPTTQTAPTVAAD
jgi:FSR family fosmidomycin resistance protein-like MFS transporter